jgi:hypothetical protein
MVAMPHKRAVPNWIDNTVWGAIESSHSYLFISRSFTVQGYRELMCSRIPYWDVLGAFVFLLED